jgi:hypothetical protein
MTFIFPGLWVNIVPLKQTENLYMLQERMRADTPILKSEINSENIFDDLILTVFLTLH